MKTLKERLAEVESLLDEYEKKVGLPGTRDYEEVPSLSWSLSDIKSKTNEELYEQLFLLAAINFNIQRLINHKVTRINWATSNLKIIFGEESQRHNVYSYDGQKNAVLASNEYARRLHELAAKSQMVVDRLSYLPAKIEFMAKQIDIILRNRKETSYAARA